MNRYYSTIGCRLLLATLFLCSLVTGTSQAAKIPSIAITQIVEHPALDACRQGVKDELRAQGFKINKNLRWTYESAQGNPTTAAQVAKKFAGSSPDVIVAISTPSAQTAAAAARQTPVVFSAVTDPVAAKLVNSLEKPGGLITGTTDLSPIDRQLALVKKALPEAKKLGVLFNPGEANSVSLVNLVKQHAPKHGLEVIEGGATKTADVLSAARAVVGKNVDVIFVPTDNTIVSAIEAVIKVGMDTKKPVFCGDTNSVVRGCAGALGFNYYDLGRQTGKIVIRILAGEKPGDIAVQSVDRLELFLNPTSAAKMGLTLSKELQAEAKKIVP